MIRNNFILLCSLCSLGIMLFGSLSYADQNTCFGCDTIATSVGQHAPGSDILVEIAGLFIGISTLVVTAIAFVAGWSIWRSGKIRSEIDKKLAEREDDIAAKWKEMEQYFSDTKGLFLSSRRLLIAYINLQAGIDIRDRIAAAQDLKQVDNIRRNWKYFKKMLDEELAQADKVAAWEPREQALWNFLIEELKDLSIPLSG